MGLVILFFGFSASGQTSYASLQDSDPVRTYKLSGTVVNSITGEAIPHALVQIFSAGNPSLLTDSNGHFEFSGLPAMSTSVVARKPGFHDERELSRGPNFSRQSSAQIGPETAPITVKLIPEGVIFGKVESGGEPVERMRIEILWPMIMQGRRNWQRREASTDEDGNFRIADLLPGTYFVSAGPSLDPAAMSISGPDAESGFAKMFYSGATEFSEATPVKLAAGQQAQVDFSLKKVPTFLLSGAVTGNEPASNISLEFKDQAGENFYFPMRFDDRTQEFSVRVPAGSYIIYARVQNQAGVALAAKVPVTVTADLTGVGVVLEPAPSIPVVVHMESSHPETMRQPGLPSRGSFDRRNGYPVNLGLESTASSINRLGFWAQAQNNAPLSISGVQSGKYNLVINAFEPWYVQSATSGSTDLLRQELEVGSRAQTLDVVLRDDGASVNGVIRSEGQPMPGAVLLVREDAPRQIKTTYAGEGGQFGVSGLAPGNYSLLALNDIENLEYSDPAVLDNYLPKATHVSLQPNQKLEITVGLIQR